MDKFEFENKYIAAGKKLIAGVDEVGRGPLAGPVVCCAVIMPADNPLSGIDDSKKLTEKRRKELDALIRECAVAISIAEVSPKEIDKINILNAVKKGMVTAVEGLSVTPDAVLVDGNNIKLGIDAEYIIGGDGRSYTIGAASIVAKVYRDEMMVRYAALYPEYGFDRHKGYGTREHIEKIKEIGPCPLHRKTFIKRFWAEQGKSSPQNI